MATSTHGFPIAAYSRCTEKSGFATEDVQHHLKSNVTYGPDGTEWVLLSDDDLQAFCSGRGKMLEHRGKDFYDHACASFGAWAFDARDSTYVCCVVFLHYNISQKLNKTLGEVDSGSGAKKFQFSGAKLLEKYQALNQTLNAGQREAHGRAAHVWERKKHGEIAIDFCLKV
jgi:hypothetical protein